MATILAVPMAPRADEDPDRDQEVEAAELRQLRDKLGYTQERTARKLGVTYGTYWRWESGGDLCPLMAIELMRAWARESAQEARSSKKTKRKA